MKIGTLLERLALPVLVLTLSGCAARQPPATPRNNVWLRFNDATGRENVLFVQVNPVGPPRWRYVVESLRPNTVTNRPPPGWSGTGWFPAWHPPGVALTNVALDVTGCRVVDVSTNWVVAPGSSFLFQQIRGGASELRFTLEGERTNGLVELRITDVTGTNTFVPNLNGPR